MPGTAEVLRGSRGPEELAGVLALGAHVEYKLCRVIDRALHRFARSKQSVVRDHRRTSALRHRGHVGAPLVSHLRPLVALAHQHPDVLVTVCPQQPETEWSAVAVGDDARPRRYPRAREHTPDLRGPHGLVIRITQIRVSVPED